jgi:hypothetical protein
LAHLDDIVDGNSPFKLYKKTGGDKHFKFKPDDVEPPEEMGRDDTTNVFRGIGVVEIRYEKMRTTGMGTSRPITGMSRPITGMSRQITGMSDSMDEAMVGVRVLIDPMTKEVINKVAELDEYGKPKLDSRGKPIYTVNDSWFILNMKFAWKDAPEPPALPVPTVPGDYGYDRMSTTSAGTPVGTEESDDTGSRPIGLEDF